MKRSWIESILIASAGRRGGRFVRALFRDANLSPLVQAQSRHGPVFALDPGGVIDAIVVREGCYEPEVLDIILEYLPRGGVFWDVGANFGIHAITVKHLRPDATVVAFEPVPVAGARLMLNAELNRSDIKLIPWALGPRSGHAEMSVKLRGNTGLSSLSPWPGSQYDAKLTVRVERGDEAVAAGLAPPPSVVKLDVEGFEKEVLLGLGSLLDEAVAIVFESAPDKLREVSELLEARGFIVSQIPAGPKFPAVNYLARRISPNERQ